MTLHSRRWSLAVTCLLLAGEVLAQSTGATVRHHKVAVNAPSPDLTQAESAIEKKDYATAEPLLKKVVTTDPANYQAWFDLGFVYNASGDPAQSIASYRKAVEAKPDLFEANLNLGLMLVKSGQPGAEQFLRAATTLKPTARVEEGQERAWISLAHLLETSKPDEAIAAYRKAAVLQPKDPEPLISAGALLEKQNQLVDAEQQYKQALALAPQSPDTLTALANVYMRGRRFSEAEAVLRQLVALRPDNTAAQMQLGRMLAASGQKDEAIAQLQMAAKSQPEDTELHRDLAELYLETGKFEFAQNEYESLVKANPNDPQLHYALGTALLKQHKFPEAGQEFLAAVKLKPDFGEAYGQIAVVANESKNYELVIRALDARAKYLPEIPVGYFLRATAYDHLRDVKHASENYHRFLEVADGKYPDQEWQAKHRLIAIEPKR